MLIHFENVGRSHSTFTATIAHITDACIERALRCGCQIPSNNIEFDIHGAEGIISAGFHVIGTFTLEPDAAELN